MDKEENGGPAFKCEKGTIWTGMSLRDYFATQAMLAHIQLLPREDFGSTAEWNSEIARLAYMTADAMLEERGK